MDQKKQTAQAKKRNKLAKGGKLGRPKKLTPEELRRGVEAYFASISYQEPVFREVDCVISVDERSGAITYALDEFGHRLTKLEPVLGADGRQLQRVKYIQAPGDFGLCDFLKISYDTWQRYGQSRYDVDPASDAYDPAEAQNAKNYAEIFARARGRICAYLEGASETKGGAGARFKLERIYGLSEEKKVEVSGPTIEEFLRDIGGEAEY